MPLRHYRRNRSVAATAVAAAAVVLLSAGAPLAAEGGLTLRRVMLSTGGVGYFEYEATVPGGAAELPLEVRRDRVDDVLKSIVVYDDKGGVGTISLPGREPLRDLFRELPFGPEALASPAALFTALRGAELRIDGPRALSGRLVAVTEEQMRLPGDAGTTTRHRLNLMTADGLRQAVLEDVEAIRFADAKLQAQVDAALAALAQHGERDRRTLTVHAIGSGPRTVRVAYVVEAPLWKTAYRLTLDEAAAKSGLQGWAVLENLSGEDWRAVDMTVVSGNPVTFRQALYDAYYVHRPQVPVEVLGRVLPRVDDGGSPAPRPQPAAETMRKSLARGLSLSDEAAPTGAAPAPPMPAPAMAAPPPAPGRFAALTAAEGTEATTQVTFHHPGPVSVENGHTLLLPLVSRPMPAERLALYQPATHSRHPLAAVRLGNDGGTGLPPGILTLYERGGDGVVSYVGDARLSALPAGQDRLLSFAIDQKVAIDRSEDQSQILSKARVAGGVLQLVTTERAVTTYTVAGAPREARRVVIEHPRRAGWELVSPPATPVEVTADAYRLTLEVAAGTSATLAVTTERPRQDRFELLGLSSQQVEVYAASRDLPAELREALSRIAALRATQAEREAAVGRLEAEAEELDRDQQRLRDNLQAVGAASDIGRRYMTKLGEQEDRVERLGKALTAARAAVEDSKKAVADTVKGLKF